MIWNFSGGYGDGAGGESRGGPCPRLAGPCRGVRRAPHLHVPGRRAGPREVHDLAAVARARTQPAGAPRPRGPVPSRCVVRRVRGATRHLAGPAGRGAGDARRDRRTHRRDGQPRGGARRRGRAGRPGRRQLPAGPDQLARRVGAAALLGARQGLLRLQGDDAARRRAARPAQRHARLPPPPNGKPLSRAELEADLAETARRGWAMTWEELEEGLVALAAPVHARDGTVVAAVSVSGPTTRITAADVPRLGEQLATDTTAISRQLGYRPGKAKP